MDASVTLATSQVLPPPPWRLHGEACVALRLVPQRIARSLLPADVPIFCSLCRRTIALLYIAHYRDSPVGEYRELIVAPAIVRHAGRIAFWISHIVVDSEASAIAGRALWALPKVLGSFDWHLRHRPRARLGLRVPLAGMARSRFERRSHTFPVHGFASVSRVRAVIDLSGARELQALGFEQSHAMYRLTDMRLTIGNFVDTG
jgi:hypothetical protein